MLGLLDILQRTTFFKFNGDSYQQTDRVAMEGPTSDIVLEIYVQSLRQLPPKQQTTLPKSGNSMWMTFFFYSTQNQLTRTSRAHQQFTSPDKIYQRRRKQLHSFIPRHLSTEIITKPSR